MLDVYLLRNSIYQDFFRYLGDTRQDERARQYIVENVVDDLAISVLQVRDHLKQEAECGTKESYLKDLITTATMAAEFITRRELLEKTFSLYMDSLPDEFRILKSPVLSVTSLQYLHTDNVTWVTIPSTDYYLTKSNTYPTVCLDSGKYWPTITNDRRQNIKLTFKAGWDSNWGVPKDLQMAMLHHIAVLHEQRGDWGTPDAMFGGMLDNLPVASKLIYSRYRITNRR